MRYTDLRFTYLLYYVIMSTWRSRPNNASTQLSQMTNSSEYNKPVMYVKYVAPSLCIDPSSSSQATRITPPPFTPHTDA